MKIIFIKDVKKQGKKDDIKEVKDGFGEFLIKSGNAVLYTDKSVQKLEIEKQVRKDENDKIKKDAEELKKNIENISLKFKVKTGQKDKVFGNVSSKQISEELKNNGFIVDKKKIETDYPLNMLGKYTVKVSLHKDVIANIKVELVK